MKNWRGINFSPGQFTAGIWSIPRESRTENEGTVNPKIDQIAQKTTNRIFLHYDGSEPSFLRRGPQFHYLFDFDFDSNDFSFQM
jgi:hypothetical protein